MLITNPLTLEPAWSHQDSFFSKRVAEVPESRRNKDNLGQYACIHLLLTSVFAPTVSRPYSGNLFELSQLFLWCGFFLSSCLTIPAWRNPHHRSLHQRYRYKPAFLGQKHIWLCRSNALSVRAQSCFEQRPMEGALCAAQTLWPQRRSDCSVFTKASNIYFEKLSHSKFNYLSTVYGV